jgi:IS30 family transposase
MREFFHLSLEDRKQIENAFQAGKTLGQVADELNRSKNTIIKEITRNYCAETAQKRHDTIKSKSCRENANKRHKKQIASEKFGEESFNKYFEMFQEIKKFLNQNTPNKSLAKPN